MKLDMHTHCLPVSKCARVDADQLPSIVLSEEIDAIVLTNHCYPRHCDSLSDDLMKQAHIYVDVYRRCKAAGEKVGVLVIFGVEVKLINEPHTPEFLLYGISEDEFINSYPLYNLTQKELFDFCNKKDILMVQAHPFRSTQGYEPADMRYLHGLEAYNPHHSGAQYLEACLELAEQNGIIVTAGSDFHTVDQAGSAWMLVSDQIEDQFMLRDHLKKEKAILFGREGCVCINRP